MYLISIFAPLQDEYLLKWGGWSLYDCTWEPEANVSKGVKRAFSKPIITANRLVSSCDTFYESIQSHLSGNRRYVINVGLVQESYKSESVLYVILSSCMAGVIIHPDFCVSRQSMPFFFFFFACIAVFPVNQHNLQNWRIMSKEEVNIQLGIAMLPSIIPATSLATTWMNCDTSKFSLIVLVFTSFTTSLIWICQLQKL